MDNLELQKLLEEDEAKPEVSAKVFLYKTLLWIPVCFAGWYMFSAVFSFPAIKLSDWLLPWILPGVFEGVEKMDPMVNVVTQLDVKTASGQVGQIILDFNALKYGYGFPLLMAMMLATPYSIYEKLDDITYGLILVVLTQTWGIIFESLTSLMLKAGGEVASQVVNLLPFTESGIFLNIIALGYQLGVLVLPALVPIAFWIMRHPGLLETMAATQPPKNIS